MVTDEQNKDFQRLHRLIGGAEDIKGFLNGMTRYAAVSLSRATGEQLDCAVTLHRRKRRVTIAGSSDAANLFDDIEHALGDGPCLEAVRTLKPVLLSNTAKDQRWPDYGTQLTAAGVQSVLSVPLPLGNDASAALSFFSPATGVFTEEVIDEAAMFGDMAAQALRLAVRIATADLLAEDLKAAMENRTAIDLATGMIMSQNKCTPEEAFDVLSKASSNRNQKLHAVAADIISAHPGAPQPPSTHFDT